MNTQLWYMYRDGSNYKANETLVLEGECTFEDVKAFLDEGRWFIPSQVGLPDLQKKLYQYDGPGEDDHIWHELDDGDFSLTDSEPTAPVTAADFIANMKKAHEDGWDIAAAMARNGMEGEIRW